MAAGCTLSLAVVLVLAFGLLAFSCAPKGGQAERQSRALVADLNRGSCDRVPKGLDPVEWAPACAELLAAIDGGTPVVVGSTVTSNSGEIGYGYHTVATFTDRNGDPHTIELTYVGEGFFATTPRLYFVHLDDAHILYGGRHRPSTSTTTRP